MPMVCLLEPSFIIEVKEVFSFSTWSGNTPTLSVVKFSALYGWGNISLVYLWICNYGFITSSGYKMEKTKKN